MAVTDDRVSSKLGFCCVYIACLSELNACDSTSASCAADGDSSGDGWLMTAPAGIEVAEGADGLGSCCRVYIGSGLGFTLAGECNRVGAAAAAAVVAVLDGDDAAAPAGSTDDRAGDLS